MSRYLILAVLNLSSVVALYHLAFDPWGRVAGPPMLTRSLEASLGFPLIVSARLLKVPGFSRYFRYLFWINAWLWAGIVEFVLRRFVDRPKDSDAGKGE